ncbi:MAG TPA: alpha/beta hydrolase family protein [Mycobacteriales bacterium]|nr:alpha/beta hydrolase family protein [Mycobacteriales bacterium]
MGIRRSICGAGAAAVLCGSLLATPVAAASLPSPECLARTAPVPSGPATLVSDVVVKGYGGRLHDLTLRSPAVGSDIGVYVYLPKHFSQRSPQRYHVLYLLHGSGGSEVDWTKNGAEQILAEAGPKAHLPSTIVVMPDDALEGYYTDWYGRDLLNPAETVAPGWATFQIHELIPYVDSHYPTIAARRGRAIAGLSMGGFGATSLAARNPGMFSVVGSFSGADDIDYDAPYEAVILEGTSPVFTGGVPTTCIWGDPLTHRIGWESADPTYLAPDLAGTRLYLATGNGTPGPLDDLTNPTGIATAAAGGAVELDISEMNAGFVSALNAAHVPHTDYFYGAGTHSWGYWERDLRRFIPFLVRGWRHPDPAPSSFSDLSAATRFTAWGWTFVVHRSVEEFTYLRDVTSQGFEAAGSGTLRATDPHGRTFTVSLGSHAGQQTSFPSGGALPAGWTWRRVGHPGADRE